jgi:hypothetical protein
MGIIIKELNGEYWLHSVSHTPVSPLPFTNPYLIKDFCYYSTVGRIQDLGKLVVDKEYPFLDYIKDFDVVERISQVKHENGLVYDDLIYKLKDYDYIEILLPPDEDIDDDGNYIGDYPEIFK